MAEGEVVMINLSRRARAKCDVETHLEARMERARSQSWRTMFKAAIDIQSQPPLDIRATRGKVIFSAFCKGLWSQ